MKIGLILIAYKTNRAALFNKIEKYSKYFEYCIVVDNTPNGVKKNSMLFPNCQYVELGENLGIAKAQNIGSEKIIEKGVDYLMFLDQDSFLPFDDFITLKKSLEELRSVRLGAIGPQPINSIKSGTLHWAVRQRKIYPIFRHN
jgi:rhamnosyltransferase